METNAKEEKSCINCKFYLAHYIKRQKDFHPTYCGHCVIGVHRISKMRKLPKLCEKWEPVATRIEERKQFIINTIEKMLQTLESISQVLKDDAKYKLPDFTEN